MRYALDHCARRVRDDVENKRKAVEYTPGMTAYRDTLEGRSPKELADEIAVCLCIHEDDLQREIVEALLLGKCPAEDIETQFRVSQPAQELYTELFFDVTAFRTQLDVISYLENYENPLGKDLKVKSVNVGYEYVCFKYGSISVDTELQRKLVKSMFMSTACKAMAMNYATMDSNSCKLAVKHAELMLKAYAELAKTDGDEGNNEFDMQKIIPAVAVTSGDEPEINPAEIV